MRTEFKDGIFALATTLGLALAGAAGAEGDVAAADATVVKAKAIHVGDGVVIENGMVLIVDGRIEAVGADVAVPEGANVIDVGEGSVTPGLIDANALLEPEDLVSSPEDRRSALEMMFRHEHSTGATTLCDGSTLCSFANNHEDLEPDQICPICGQADDGSDLVSGVRVNPSTTEASSEVVPDTSAVDAINFKSPDFGRLLRGGVTTVFASPDSAAVIGPRGAIVRTAGPLSQRIIVENADVQATLGADAYRVGGGNGTPSRFRGVTARTRRPNSRMGVAWVFRKAFHDAEKLDNGHDPFGADTADEDALRLVRDVREGRIPLRVQARAQRDIVTALRLAEEFDLEFTLLEATDAYRCIDEIAARGMPVVFGPIDIDGSGVRRFSGEIDEAKLSTMRVLLDAGVETALSAQDLREEDGLARQAMYAIRAGLTTEEALRSVTSTPAKLLGIDDEVGTIEPGKRADLVIWNGEPFAATSRPTTVMINGRVEFDARNN